MVRDRLPPAFPRDYDALRPSKVGILADPIARMPGFDPVVLRRTLANPIRRDGYWLALIHGRGDRRYDLDGQPAGIATGEKRAEAAQRLAAAQHRQQEQAGRVRSPRRGEAPPATGRGTAPPPGKGPAQGGTRAARTGYHRPQSRPGGPGLRAGIARRAEAPVGPGVQARIPSTRRAETHC
jgi:sRNA-binding protein